MPAHEQFGTAVYATCSVHDGEVSGMDVERLLLDATAAGIAVDDWTAVIGYAPPRSEEERESERE